MTTEARLHDDHRDMEVALALLADAANVTANGKLNVLGAFTSINVRSGFPYRHPSMTLVVQFEADRFEAGSEKQIEVVLSNPDGGELARLSAKAKLPETKGPEPISVVIQLQFANLKFAGGGPHAFVIMVGGETKRRVGFMVNDLTGEEATGGAADGA